ncbi:hypothetical protein CBR_g34416 [Chara braunii]|uniref:Integrase catalytic domain-containing protein n=1 Tax=Chara braunii TaxID=69332 RepID=A0A388LIR9_CHABU|nr:hypothetical protein CBR_g34416 [Chara braunii]|eukprot:GBG82135.1 hypothetical protein CBR_g34416 [Chara braunii]
MEIARYVNRFLGMHQDTEEILTDNGAEFRGEVLRNLVLHGVAIRNTASHMSQSNGLVENANWVIKTALQRNIAARDPRPCPDIVDHILAVHRGTSHESTGLSPFQLRTNSVWRTSVEGEILAFLFGTVRPGYWELIAQELTILVAQLADDLPLDIIAQDDEHLVLLVLYRTLTPYLQWSACVEGAAKHIPPSQQQYLDPRTALDPAFFRYPTSEQFAAIREEEEEEDSTGSDEGEGVRDQGGDSDEVLGEEDETPEEGSYSEHSEGEQSEEEEDEEGEEEHEEEHEEGPAGSEWEAVPEEALRTGTEAEDPEAARKREEIAAGKKELELASAASLHIHDDPNRDPEPPRPEDGDLAATTPTPSVRRRRFGAGRVLG